MMLLFAIFMDYGVEDKKENLKNIKKKDWGKEDWKNEEREAYKKQLGYLGHEWRTEGLTFNVYLCCC